MKVFLIGGTGLLGSEAAKVLIERGHKERLISCIESIRKIKEELISYIVSTSSIACRGVSVST